MKIGINASPERFFHVYKKDALDRIRQFGELPKLDTWNDDSVESIYRMVEGAEVIFGTWGMKPFDEKMLSHCPDLKAVFYAAGSVKSFVTPELIEKNIPIVSAVSMNAVPVAEFTLGLILSSLKDVFWYQANKQEKRSAIWDSGPDGKNKEHSSAAYYRSKICLFEFGQITRKLLELLKPFDLDVYVVSPWFGENEERLYGATKGNWDWCVENCDVISIHCANTPNYHGLINKEVLERFKPGARLINTSRGPMIHDEELIAFLKKRPDVSAYLDVFNQEPLPNDHPYFDLPNAILTPHIAGSIGREVQRMAHFVIDQFEKHYLKDKAEDMAGRVDLSKLASLG